MPINESQERLQVIYAELPKIECKRLCQEYCGPLLLPRVEYVQIEKSGAFMQLGSLAAIQLGKQWKWMPKEKLVAMMPGLENRCSLLYPSGKCRVYAARPLICRIWGMMDTPSMRCPHGCRPDRWLSQEEVRSLMQRILEIPL